MSPRPRFENLSAERRSELLECAANEFAQHGYRGASLNRIIAGAGLSKGVFYYYFDDKADLFETVVGYAFDHVVGSTRVDVAALDRESFWPALQQMYVELLPKTHDLPWLAGIGKLAYQSAEDPELEELVARHFLDIRRFVMDLLQRGRDVGAVRDDGPLELLVAMVFGALEASDRWFVETWDGLSSEERERIAATVFEATRRMAEVDGEIRAGSENQTERRSETHEKHNSR